MERYMKKRKVTAVLLAAMMCMQIIAGCGTKNDAAQTESSVAATEDAQGAAGENTQTAGQNATEENAGGMAEQNGAEESIAGNDAAGSLNFQIGNQAGFCFRQKKERVLPFFSSVIL